MFERLTKIVEVQNKDLKSEKKKTKRGRKRGWWWWEREEKKKHESMNSVLVKRLGVRGERESSEFSSLCLHFSPHEVLARAWPTLASNICYVSPLVTPKKKV